MKIKQTFTHNPAYYYCADISRATVSCCLLTYIPASKLFVDIIDRFALVTIIR